MKKGLLNIATLLILLLSTITGTYAQIAPQPVIKTFDVRPGGQLTIDLDLGSIAIKTNAGNQVRIAYTKSVRTDINIGMAKSKKLKFDRLVQEALTDFVVIFERKDSNIIIKGKFKRGWEYWLRLSQQMPGLLSKLKIDFQGTVPYQYNTDLNTSLNDISVADIAGTVRAQTSLGNLRLGKITGSVWGRTSSGGTITLKRGEDKVDVKNFFGEY